MQITIDTNLLVRAATKDNPGQAAAAMAILAEASVVAITLVVLCEFVWVVRAGYKFTAAEAASSIRKLLRSSSVECDRSAVEAGLRMLDAGGDFADGVIAHQGAWLGGTVFVSFDRKAVRLLSEQGYQTKLLHAGRAAT